MPYLDDATMHAIESDLAAAHQSLAGYGSFDMKGATKTGVKILETVVPAAAFSYLNARSVAGEVKIGPIPLDLGVGIAAALLSMFDIAGGYEEDLLNIGIGALASYGARTGAAFGAAARSATTTTQGAGAMAHGPHNAPLPAARLRNIAEQRRMHHHVSGIPQGMAEISGAAPPPGTSRFVVQRVA